MTAEEGEFEWPLSLQLPRARSHQGRGGSVGVQSVNDLAEARELVGADVGAVGRPPKCLQFKGLSMVMKTRSAGRETTGYEPFERERDVDLAGVALLQV